PPYPYTLSLHDALPIYRQDLHVDRHVVHLLQPLLGREDELRDAAHALRLDGFHLVAGDFDRGLDEAMRMRVDGLEALALHRHGKDRKSTRLNSSHDQIS